MIVLYDKFKSGNFDRNDLVLRNVTKCEVTWEKNGQYQIDLIYPIISGDVVWQNIVKGAIVKCPVPHQQDQLFRLNTPTKKMDENGAYFYVEATGYHITYDLAANFLEDVRPTGKTGLEAGQYILDNTQYSHPFNWIGDIATVGTAYYIRQNPIDALIGDNDNAYKNVWGGELVRDNFTIGMFNQAGENRGVTIRYSKNLTGFEQSADDSNMITRAMPYITDDSTSTDDSTTQSTDSSITPVIALPEKFIDSPKINDYANIYVKPVEVTLTDDQKNLSTDQKYQIMRDYVNDLYENQNVDVPVYSYSINFIELCKTEEYKEVAILEEVHPYDFVTIKALDVDVIAELVGYTYDSITKLYEEVTLGNVRNDIIRSNQKSLFQISQQNQQSIKILQAQMGDIPGTILNVATSTTSGNNNLFDHAVAEDKYLSEWTTTGSSVVEDDTLHDTDKVWKLPPNTSLSKSNVLVNPNNYKNQQLMFSLQAKYSGLTITDSGQYNVPNQTNVLLGALDAVIKRCLVDTTGTTWNYNSTSTGIITERIGVTAGTAITINNTQGYPYTIHAWDNLGNQLSDFTTGPIPANVFQISVEILQPMSPMAIMGFSIFETNSYTAQSVSFLYANKTDCDWQVQEQNFQLMTEHPSDVIQQINFRASNGDASGTVYIGAFMINTGTVRSDFSQSSNDTVQTLRAHQIVADYISAKQADIDELHATNATVQNLSSTYATINSLNATNATIQTLTTTKANVTDLTAINASISSLTTDKADVTDLNATNGNISNLTTSVGTIMDLTTNTLKAQIITANSLAAGAITAGSAVIANSAIASAQIISLDLVKLNAGTISTDKFVVQSDSGNLQIKSNVLKVWDTTGKERISLGLNGTDYNLLVRGTDGTTVLFGTTGVTKAGITTGAVDDSKIDTNANINASKINIDSMFTQLNGNTNTLKASKIKFDDTGQTLDVEFTNLSDTVTSQGTTISNQSTSITTLQGQISSKVTQTDINSTLSNNNLALNFTNAVGVSVVGNNITATASNWGSSGCSSIQSISNGQYIECTITSAINTGGVMFGASHTDSDQSFPSIQYAWYIDLTSHANGLGIWENGTNIGVYGTWAIGDTFRIAIENNAINYYQNGVLKYTSAQIPSLPLVLDMAFYTSGSTLSDIKLGTMISGLSTRMSSAEQKILPDAIVSTVSQSIASQSSTVFQVANSDSGITYAGGTWLSETLNGSYNGKGVYCNTANSYIQYSFVGTGINIYNDISPNMGIVQVYIDGTASGSPIDCYSSTSGSKHPIFSISTLAYGKHTVKVVVTGTKNTHASNYYFELDYLEVLNAQAATTITNIISSINQSAEAISISASKLNLNGYVTLTNLATAGQTTINGGSIISGTITANSLAIGTGEQGGYCYNAAFTHWSGAYPDGTVQWVSGGIVKATYNGITVCECDCPVSGTQYGMQLYTGFFANGINLEGGKYFCLQMRFRLTSGTNPSGATFLVDVHYTDGSMDRLELDCSLAGSTLVTGTWYTVSKIFMLPDSSTTSTKTFANLQGYLLGNWNGAENTIKTIQFSNVNVYPATQQQYLAQSWTYPNATTINGGSIQTNSITASQIATGTITATSGTISSLSANVLTGGTLDAKVVNVINLNAGNINAGSLSASRISGGTLTLGGSGNGNGLALVENASNQEVVRLDTNGLTITLQQVGGLLANAFNIKAYNGTTLMNIDGDGQLIYHGVMELISGSDTVTIDSRNIYMGDNVFNMGIGTGDGASWTSYNAYIQSWQGLAFGTDANYDGTGTAFKPRIVMNCRTGDLTLKSALYATGFQRTSDSKWAVFSSNIDNIFYQGTGFNWVSGGTGYWVYQSGGSDERLKSNIMPSTKSCLDTINNIGIVQYNWIADAKHVDVGVTAQQMSTLNPEFMRPFMTKDNVDYYAPNWDKVMPYIVGSLQEEDSKIQELELKIANLENEIAQLKSAS